MQTTLEEMLQLLGRQALEIEQQRKQIAALRDLVNGHEQAKSANGVHECLPGDSGFVGEPASELLD